MSSEKTTHADHRDINKRLKIFAYLQTEMGGAGLLTWLPNGEVIRQELEYFGKETEARAGYKRVSTPVLAPQQLYEASGHYPYYVNGMYQPISEQSATLYVRPMSCPHHHYVAKELLCAEKLPLRIAEFGNVFRYEASGTVSGLMRARGFTQNDAHIYCTESQLEGELVSVLNMHRYYFDHFGIADFHVSFALPDLQNTEKYSNDQDAWNKSIKPLKAALVASGFPFIEEEGEAAFYGPKIDFIIRSSAGKNYTISTTQLDYMAAKRFQFLCHKSNSGPEEPLYVIHRAPLGSHERFIGFLLEHYNGKLPTWLAPKQFSIIPVTSDANDYAESLYARLMNERVHSAAGMLRGDARTEKGHMNKKIREAIGLAVPRIALVGDKERANGTVALRLANGKSVEMKSEAFVDLLRDEVNTRKQIDPARPDRAVSDLSSQAGLRL